MKCFNVSGMLVKFCLWFVMLAIGVACRPVESEEPTAVSIAKVVTSIPATRTLSPPTAVDMQTPQPPTVTPTAAITPSSTPSPTPDFSCPNLAMPAPFTQPADTAELQEQILTYLNAGGQSEDLANLVTSLEIEGHLVTVDMNGDGILEIILNLAVVSEEFYPYAEHSTWVLQCRSGSYITALDVYWGLYHYFDSTILEDLNNDGGFEAIIIGGLAGSACEFLPTVLRWENGQVIKYFPAHPPQPPMSCSVYNRITSRDIDNDGFKDLIVAGSPVTFVTSGPTREITHTFSLQDESLKLLTTQFAPARHRFEVLDDAQQALYADDLLLAAQLYDQAAHDDTLENYPSHRFPPYHLAPEENSTKQDFPNEYQRAFALFRLAAIQFVLGNEADVTHTLAELEQSYSEETPGHEFILLAHTLVDELTTGTSPSSACQKVAILIETNYPELETHFYWGSNNISYWSQSICPFAAP